MFYTMILLVVIMVIPTETDITTYSVRPMPGGEFETMDECIQVGDAMVADIPEAHGYACFEVKHHGLSYKFKTEENEIEL